MSVPDRLRDPQYHSLVLEAGVALLDTIYKRALTNINTQRVVSETIEIMRGGDRTVEDLVRSLSMQSSEHLQRVETLRRRVEAANYEPVDTGSNTPAPARNVQHRTRRVMAITLMKASVREPAPLFSFDALPVAKKRRLSQDAIQ